MKSRSIHTFATPYNVGRVTQNGRRLDMEVEGATFASWHPEQLLTGYSWDALSAAALLHSSGQPGRILLIGLAGGTMVRILRHLVPRARITAVELDGKLVDIAVRHMHLDLETVDLHIGDAYAYLRKTRKRFDVVLDDLYLSGATDVYRPASVDRTMIMQYRRLLRDDGIVAVNMITDTPHRAVLRETREAWSREFKETAAITAPRGYNQALIGGERLNSASVLETALSLFTTGADRRMWKQLRVSR